MIVRRTATGAVALGALLTVVLGGMFVWFAAYVLDEEPVWAPIQGILGAVCVITGAVCIVQVGRDLARGGSLTRRGEWWAWTATTALSLAFFASVWFYYVGVLCPFLTLFAVRWARGPLRRQ
jgi:hypothetical protein